MLTNPARNLVSAGLRHLYTTSSNILYSAEQSIDTSHALIYNLLRKTSHCGLLVYSTIQTSGERK